MKKTIEIEAVSYTQAIQDLKFIKGITTEQAKEQLANDNVMDFDDVFILIGLDGKAYARPWNVSEPRILEVKM